MRSSPIGYLFLRCSRCGRDLTGFEGQKHCPDCRSTVREIGDRRPPADPIEAFHRITRAAKRRLCALVGTRPYPAEWEDEGPIPIETFFYRCDRCGYDMRGLEHMDICPECGHDMREAA